MEKLTDKELNYHLEYLRSYYNDPIKNLAVSDIIEAELKIVVSEVMRDSLLVHVVKGGCATGEFHGARHWANVFYNSIQILSRMHKDKKQFIGKNYLLRGQLRIALLFSLFHDCRRTHDGRCLVHGSYGALVFTDEVVKDFPSFGRYSYYVAAACNLHTLVDRPRECVRFSELHKSLRSIVGICLDSDRLDLFRVGQVPKEEYLYTQEAKDILTEITKRIT